MSDRDPTKAASPPLEPGQRGGLRRTWDSVRNRPGPPIYDENHIEPGAAVASKPAPDEYNPRGSIGIRPDPGPADAKNTAYHYDPADPGELPPVASPETLEVLARARGRAALDEVVGAIRALDLILADPRADDVGRAAYERRGGGSVGRKRPPYRPVSIDAAARRTIYHDRCRGLAGLLAVELPAIIDPRLTTAAQARGELARVDGSIGDRARVAGNADAYGRLGYAPPYDVAELDGAILKLEARRTVAMAPAVQYPVQGGFALVSRDRLVFGQDVVIESLNALFRRKAELLDQVEQLDRIEAARAAAAAELVASTAAAVRAAVEGAGGVAAVVDRLIVARALASPPIGDPGAATLFVIDEDLRKLERASVDPESGAVVSLKARRVQAVAAAESARQEHVGRRRSAAEDLVDDALAGGASAAAEVTGLLSRGDLIT